MTLLYLCVTICVCQVQLPQWSRINASISISSCFKHIYNHCMLLGLLRCSVNTENTGKHVINILSTQYTGKEESKKNLQRLKRGVCTWAYPKKANLQKVVFRKAAGPFLCHLIIFVLKSLRLQPAVRSSQKKLAV